MKEQINKNKVIIIVAVAMILAGIVFLITSIGNLNKAIKLDTFYGQEPIKTGQVNTNKEEEYKNVFSIVTGELGEDSNPLFAEMQGEKIVSELVFEPLFKKDTTGQLKRVLAENIRYLDEEKTIIVTIKEGILFSDGSKLTTEDVENAILFHTLQGSTGTNNILGVKDFLSNPSKKLEGVKVIEDNQIQITFSKYEIENELVLELLIPKSSHIDWTFDKNLLEQVQEYLGDGIGTNSYYVAEKTGKYFVLLENNNYRDEIKDVKQVNVYHQSAVDIDGFVAENMLDMTTFHRDSGFYNVIYNSDNTDVYSQEQIGTLSLFFNMENEFVKNNNLRQGISKVLDRDKLVELKEINKFMPVSSMLPKNGMFESIHNNTTNISEGKELIEQAKIELALEKISLYLPVVKDNDIQKVIAYEIKEQLSAVGVDVTIDELSLSNYMDAIYLSKRYSFYISELNAVTGTESINEFASQFFYDDELPLDLQMEFVVFAKGEEETLSAYEALNKALNQESSIIPLARVQNFIATSTYWNDVVILPDKVVPHNLHLLEKRK